MANIRHRAVQAKIIQVTAPKAKLLPKVKLVRKARLVPASPIMAKEGPVKRPAGRSVPRQQRLRLA
jgi:hypothetical protein